MDPSLRWDDGRERGMTAKSVSAVFKCEEYKKHSSKSF
jgi:hypothetical protein